MIKILLLGLLSCLFMASDCFASPEKSFLTLSLPNGAGHIILPSARLKLLQEKSDPSGARLYLMFQNPESGLVASFMIEPVARCKTQEACLENILKNPLYAGMQNYESLKSEVFSIARFSTSTKFQNINAIQSHYSAQGIVNNYWVNVHLSQTSGQVDFSSLANFMGGLSLSPNKNLSEGISHSVIVPGGGIFTVAFPKEATVATDFSNHVLTIAGEAKEKQNYSLQISPAHIAENTSLGEDRLDQSIDQMVQQIKDQAVEEKINVYEIKGPNLRGKYIKVTDKAPKPGEYKFLVQGVVIIGHSFSIFTALHNDETKGIEEKLLGTINAATFEEL